MPCFHPMQAWYAKTKNESGKRSLVFSSKHAQQADDPIEISCGQCVGCRLERSRQWATRCVHETSLYEDNCFITLTYSDEGLQLRENQYISKNLKRHKKNLPPLPVPHKESLDVRDFQLFMKRLRKKYGQQIRFYQCGEYGEQEGRPHYHAIIFNFNFPDREHYTNSVTGDKYYISTILNQLWPYGFAIIGEATFESAAYVARYIMKKINGDKADAHYTEENCLTGDIIIRKPEYTTMSRRPGIGKKWFDQFKGDLYPKDFITVNKKKCTVPKYYDGQLQLTDQYLYEEIKENRLNNINVHHKDLTPDRLQEREKCIKIRLKQLERKL